MEPSPWPDLAGRLTDEGHVLPVRVYYEDTDFSGRVYHAGYLRFMERGRSDFLRLMGVGHEALGRGAHGEPLAFAVRHMTIDFRGAARIDDVVEVVTRLAELSGARVVLDQAVRQKDVPLVSAAVTVALVNAAGRPRRLPAEVRRRLSAQANP